MPTKAPLSSPGREILEYLARHPNAQDTVEGILRWWVLDACIRKWAPRISKTLARLVESGHLEATKPTADGRVFYRLSARCRAKLKGRSRRKP